MEHKEAGNQLFKEGKWSEALDAYSRGLASEDLPSDVRGLLLSNRSQCYLNLEEWQLAHQDADACLQLLPSHSKSMFRRAVASEHLGKPQDAAVDFIQVIKLEPKNKAATDAARRLRTQLLAVNAKKTEASLPANVVRVLQGGADQSTDEQKLDACKTLRQTAYQGKAEALMSAGAFELLLRICTDEEVKQELRGAALGALVALASGKESAAQEDDDDLMAQAELNPKDPLPVTPAAADARERVRKAYPVSEMKTLCHGHAECMAQQSLLLGYVYEVENILALNALEDAMSSGLEGHEVDAPRAGVLALLRICDTRRRLGKHGDPVMLSQPLRRCLEAALNVTSCPDLLKALLASVFTLLADDDRPKGLEVNLAEEAAKLLEPFLQSSDMHLKANGVGGLSVLFEANSKAAAKAVQQSAAPLMAILGTLTASPADLPSSSVQEDAANCLLYATSEQETRAHLLNCGSIDMLLRYLGSTDGAGGGGGAEETVIDKGVRTKLIGVLSVMAAHSKEVREEVFDRIDFLMELRHAVTVAKELRMELGKVGESKAAKKGSGSSKASKLREVQKLTRGLYESCACLAIHGEFKEMLVGSKKTLRAIQDLATPDDLAEDPALGFFYVSLIYNLCLSKADKVRPKKQSYPLSELADDDLDALEESMDKLPAEMRPVKNGDVDAGSVELAQQLRSWCVLLSEDTGKKGLDRSSHASPVIVNLAKCVSKGSAGVRNLIALIFKYLCSTKEHRQYLVTSGGVRTLLKLVDLEDAKARDAARQALAQICIVTNPALLQYSEQLDAVRPLAEMFEHTHELMQFEGAMGLTNLLLVSDELRSRALQADAWRRSRDLLFSENEMVQRAGLEAMCNLCLAEEILEKFASGKCALEIKLFIAFAASEDLATQNASTGALAMLSEYPVLVAKIVESENFERLLELLSSQIESSVQHRLVACLNNLCSSEEGVPDEIKKRILESLQQRHAGLGFQSEEAAAMVVELLKGM